MLLKRKNLIMLLCVGIIFIVALSMRIYHSKYRYGLNIDELMSISISEYNIYGWAKPFDSNKLWDLESFKKAMLWNDPTWQGAIKDVINLYKDNRDSSHTNLYYSLFRLWHTGFVNNDLHDIMKRGMGLNIVFFVISFFFAFLLAKTLLYNISKDSQITMGGGGANP